MFESLSVYTPQVFATRTNLDELVALTAERSEVVRKQGQASIDLSRMVTGLIYRFMDAR